MVSTPSTSNRSTSTSSTGKPGTSTSRLSRVRASELRGRGWLNTGGEPVTLESLRGKIVILDFWTFCCINCLHVLDELRPLELAYPDEVVLVGVHSPKFDHEADPQALKDAVERYEVHHPVLDDPALQTWQAYGARAWPTLVVIDPEGYIVAQMAGEGHASALEALVKQLVTEHSERGTLHRGSGPYVPPPPREGTLRFPSKAVALPGGNLLVSDAGHHSIVELEPDGTTLIRRIGTGQRGFTDSEPSQEGTLLPLASVEGSPSERLETTPGATFSEPNGLCLVPEHLRANLGYDVLVADTVNHALRGIRLGDGTVTTVAGTGEQFLVGGLENVTGTTGPFTPSATYPARSVRLSSPWDVQWFEPAQGFVAAMAGHHTLWLFDPAAHTIRLWVGTMNEGLVDGSPTTAWFAQPSGLAASQDGLWIADSETSALRHVTETGVTTTPVGTGLFDFGLVDGPASSARLQHPLGLAVLPDESVVIADTYNGAIRRYAQGHLTTLATGLAEPSDILVEHHGDDQITLVVVESAAHRLTRIALPADLSGEILNEGAKETQRPATLIAPGNLRLEVPFTPAPGQKIDERWGPATSLKVSATPAELLAGGDGAGTALTRDLVINPQVVEGVLHVTARAASCDDDPATEFPACHLAQQDWGVPVRVSTEGAATLTLPLAG
jgi:thiol-disulfide isomerase/thioredoxin